MKIFVTFSPVFQLLNLIKKVISPFFMCFSQMCLIWHSYFLLSSLNKKSLGKQERCNGQVTTMRKVKANENKI